MSVKSVLGLARLHAGDLRKSAAPAPKLTLSNPMDATNASAALLQTNVPQMRPGDYARVQRPAYHTQPTLARIASVGRHGITVHDDSGKQVRVRHEHVIETHPQPTPGERGQFARDLAAQGVPTGTDERYLQLDAHGRPRRRPTQSQLDLLEAMALHGTPIDIESVRESATYAEVQELLRRFVKDPTNRITE